MNPSAGPYRDALAKKQAAELSKKAQLAKTSSKTHPLPRRQRKESTAYDTQTTPRKGANPPK